MIACAADAPERTDRATEERKVTKSACARGRLVVTGVTGGARRARVPWRSHTSHRKGAMETAHTTISTAHATSLTAWEFAHVDDPSPAVPRPFHVDDDIDRPVDEVAQHVVGELDVVA